MARTPSSTFPSSRHDDGTVEREIAIGRAETSRAALRALDDNGVKSPSADILRGEYRARLRSEESSPEGGPALQADGALVLPVVTAGLLGYCHARSGRKREARQLLRELETAHRQLEQFAGQTADLARAARCALAGRTPAEGRRATVRAVILRDQRQRHGDGGHSEALGGATH